MDSNAIQKAKFIIHNRSGTVLTLSMVISAIDLGTNTVLMVTGRMAASGEIQILGDEHTVGRLGKGVDAAGTILPETFDRIAEILGRYREIAEGHGAERIAGYGTSALRDARNRDEFIATMKERAGVELHLLSGEREAELTWRGALFGLQLEERHVAVIDIGGGSTEIAFGSDGTFIRGTSVDVGAVRVTERFFGDRLPPHPSAITAARDFTREILDGAISLPPEKTVVGVAGTVTTLGAMNAGIPHFDADAINGRKLAREWIDVVAERLLTSTIEEIRAIRQVVHGREDILPGGVLVLSEFMKKFDVPEILVSTKGLRYGLLEEEMKKGMES